ncbi:hypothetical protein J6TS7_29390 [Paenibacillus dendritiformis]|uniref:helix-turn-helix domain-containing protein n=1 Tax=Paenibacillus TaxID=44249 RepID=UPI001B013049|nr:helix-turn-helix domain-containing protein [Paenibacillus dendritiformis]GIO79329.1 hypothetical protein J6TS7_29390 [Paenibacillus dendritiformis]
MVKKVGQDFENLMQEARQIPEVRDYLDSFSVVIGNIVYARRMQMNLSQAELAQLARTTQKRISLIECASGNVGQDVLDRVFSALRLSQIEAKFNDEHAAAMV